MRIHFTSKAVTDIQELKAYLADLSASGLANVIADIENTVNNIPDSIIQGRKTPRDDIFEKLTPKYKYLIPYSIQYDTLYILRVYHPARRPLDYAEDISFD